MVTSPHALASEAGLWILRKGGNAIEAAIAMATTLAVVYPHMCTLGGDAFWLIYHAKKKKLLGINASGRAGENVTIEGYKRSGFASIPWKGYLAANTVPGMVSGLEKAYIVSRDELSGSCSWASLLESAESYAQDGFPQSVSYARHCAMLMQRHGNKPDKYKLYPEFARVFLQEPRFGQVFRQEDLARTFRLLATHGAREFYEGSIATAICNDMARNGGVLTLNDFAAHHADFVEPMHVPYRDTEAYNLPPNSQGMASLQILNILNSFSISSPKSPEEEASYIDLIVKATKEAFYDRDRFLTDPDYATIPFDQLFSENALQKQHARIAEGSVRETTQAFDPAGDTVWLGVIDQFGNAVSYIQSIYYDFGSEIVPKGTGILLQNRGSFFSLDPTHPNALAPRKRTFHTLNPAMLIKNGKPFLIYGTMGGEGQPQTQAALVTRIVDFGLSPMEAIAKPRWLYGSAFGERSNSIKIEKRFGARVGSLLEEHGYPVHFVDAFHEMMGHAGAILVHQDTGVRQGGTDPRSDGLATGF
ncbi:MAG: gamma-glutamyltransferase [Desulfovibrio sp.]|nr:gamma-glutamyltransferase [Desulfovibrio sp.]